MTDAELEVMLDRAAKKGAREALKDIGLYDGEAYGDMREVRSLLDAWRETKRTVGQTAAKFFTMTILGLIAAGVYMEFGNK
tara:strand:- start:396 stop:638 length:243 start_codon:yes stop_codon:yes gene_type:complete